MLMFDTLVPGMTTNGFGRRWPRRGKYNRAASAGTFTDRHEVEFMTAHRSRLRLRPPRCGQRIDRGISLAGADSVVIDSSDPNLLAELALPRNAIAKRTVGEKPSGTGPFRVVDSEPGKKLSLAAWEDCWRRRPFLDAIEIEMGRSFPDQMTALEMGKADLVEVAPEQAQRISQDGRRLASSSAVELLALLFTRDVASSDDKLLRAALALSVERGSVRSVLLQGAGQPAGSILPNWMSGYGFVFPVDADLPRARQERDQVRSGPVWILGYDGSHPLARLLAERIALNAKDVGLSLQPAAAATADLRLVRIPLAAPDPWIALEGMANFAGLSAGRNREGVEELYASEVAMLATQRVIPLFHLPVSYAFVSSLNDWTLRPDGNLSLAGAWLADNRP